jgi:hypothetical protein
LNGKWGFIDKTGNQVIPCAYDDAWDFSNGLAPVELNGKCGVIDNAGKMVVRCMFDDVYLSGVDIFVGTIKDASGNEVKYYYDKDGKFLGM